jgi:hypothetical protein
MLRPIHIAFASLVALSISASTLASECFFPRQGIPRCDANDQVCVGLARSLTALNAKIEDAEKECLEKKKEQPTTRTADGSRLKPGAAL